MISINLMYVEIHDIVMKLIYKKYQSLLVEAI